MTAIIEALRHLILTTPAAVLVAAVILPALAWFVRAAARPLH